jgi:hypothetical protein
MGAIAPWRVPAVGIALARPRLQTLLETAMGQSLYEAEQSNQSGQRPPSAEDLNRQAAVQRACLREGIEWIEDGRSGPCVVWALAEPLH